MKFPSVQELRDQIARDVKKAHRYLGKLRKQETLSAALAAKQ
jgi:hypothetical protein